jgi:hypothetical protein
VTLYDNGHRRSVWKVSVTNRKDFDLRWLVKFYDRGPLIVLQSDLITNFKEGLRGRL